jgi:simple sugar transport system permease protein
VSIRRVLLSLLAPAVALGVALGISSIALLLIDESPLSAFSSMWSYGIQAESLVSMVNRATPLYISGLAVAIGFKMNLFNIGVEGQYRLAALLAAAAGASVSLPAPLHVAFIMIVAMLVGAGWAGIAGVLKVTRGVHEVISTIMLNFIGTGLGAYLLATYLEQKTGPQDLLLDTKELPASGRFPSLNPLLEAVGIEIRGDFQGFVLLAVLVGVAFYLIVWRTRFGFDLRASGLSPNAARASGVSPNAMVVRTMLLSGAIAGLVGMSDLLGSFYKYTLDFPTGLGFTGIAVALIGRNHPVGIAVGALLIGFLERSAQILDLEGIPKEIITIIQGVIILSVVIAYEVVRRLIEAQEVRAAAEQTRRALEAEEVPA